MFKFLKEKISKWTKKISKKQEEPETKPEKTPKKQKSEKKEKITEIPVPKTFNPATKIFEPDAEKAKKIKEKLIEEEEPLEEKTPEPGSKGFFQRITSRIQKTKISEEDFKEYADDLELILLENNVALEVVDKIIEDLKEKIVDKEITRKEIEITIKQSLKDVIWDILIEPFDLLEKIKKREDKSKPYIILFCGINGSGKTTTIAKLANLLKSKDIKCTLAAGDTFRAAAIDQLKKHGNKLKIHVIAQDYGSDPAAVGFDAIKYAEKHNLDCVLIDTAGRMHTSTNLLREIEKISRVCNPDLKIFVGESITGNDATEQVKAFNESIGIDAIILSKADIDEKGGTALSVGRVTEKPILYLGTGQEYKDLEAFNKEKFIEKLGLD